MSYETLDTIADSVNPLLACLALLFPWLDRKAVRDRGSPLGFWARTLLSLAAVYALMFADNRFHLWPSLGLDYSTHTAFAVAIVTSLGTMTFRWLYFLGPVLAGYAGLMMYLGYHTLADILSTAVVIGPITWVIHRVGRKGRPVVTSVHQKR